MQKFISTLLLAIFAITSAHAQLLYRVSGNDLKKESYIVGTYHLADGSYVDSIPGARAALSNVEQVYGELSMADTFNPDSVAMLQSKMILPDNQTLKDILTPEQFERLDAYYEQLVGLRLSNPMIYGQVARFSPKAIQTSLQVTYIIAKKKAAFNPQNAIDSYFQTVALQAGKQVGGLESVYFQANVLFSDPIERQVQQLMCSIDNCDYYESTTDRLTEAYYSQNLDEIMAVMDEKMENDCDATPEEEAALIDNRNHNWLQLMPAIMADHPTLFAVGAGHLPGNEGLIHLLREAGYTVEGVK